MILTITGFGKHGGELSKNPFTGIKEHQPIDLRWQRPSRSVFAQDGEYGRGKVHSNAEFVPWQHRTGDQYPKEYHPEPPYKSFSGMALFSTVALPQRGLPVLKLQESVPA
jgi:hypothetical protein